MAQLRKDPFGPAWVIISPERGLEASNFGSARHTTRSCPLCPGQEQHTGAERRALRPSGSAANMPDWQARVIDHPQALLQPKAFVTRGDDLFRHAPGSGYQELIVEHPDHHMTLDTMPSAHLIALLKLYRERLEHLSGQPDIQHVQLTRNVGAAAGANYEHPYAQLLALPVANRWVEEERTTAKAYHDAHGRCLFCDVIAAELDARERLVSYNQEFVALTPYAAKTPFEIWLLPRRHSSSFNTLSANALPLLAELLQSVLKAMNTALDHPPYNLILHSLPQGGKESYHWHIEILPRLTMQAGFDWGSGFYVNPTPPEDAARFLREALVLQEVGL